ncbi:ParA family protein [Lactococcus garvieae]|uniref:Chromosome partitioning protein n=1 Tax=Lactococcus garvieae TaxID=1363 RepID=A0A1I4GHA3_9LACT|nr:ParA family protein [Lactococcus garvieae]SFL28903.1 chromosome partitioning protein [Lactococcus garvieae]
MKIITMNVNKGGAGKTTLAHNFAEWLALKHRVLLFDFDDSANLTHRYGNFKNSEHTVISLFDTGFVKPINVNFNLDLVAGSPEVEMLKERVFAKRRREELFGRWIAAHYQELEKAYDYLVIDTENDEGILTTNALLVSDCVVGVAEPSKDSVEALPNLREFVNDLNHDFETEIKLAFVANKIDLSENSSKDLIKAMEENGDYMGYLPRRTFLLDNEVVAHMKPTSANKQDLENIFSVFEALKAQLDEEDDNGQ